MHLPMSETSAGLLNPVEFNFMQTYYQKNLELLQLVV